MLVAEQGYPISTVKVQESVAIHINHRVAVAVVHVKGIWIEQLVARSHARRDCSLGTIVQLPALACALFVELNLSFEKKIKAASIKRQNVVVHIAYGVAAGD
jgi:hypothetical protein